MARTRRPLRLDDDPRTPRRQRKKSGVNLIHEEPWFGFNVADKMPTRGDTDPAATTFTGLPGDVLEVDSITGVEVAPDEIDTIHLKTTSVATGKLQDLSVTNAKLDGLSVSTGKLQAKAATDDKIASNPHGVEPLGNANINDDPLRGISGAHVKTLTLDGYHLKDNSIGNRVLAVGLGGMSGSLPPHKIKGKIPKSKIAGVNWDDVDNKPPLASKHYVETTKQDIKNWALRTFQKKP